MQNCKYGGGLQFMKFDFMTGGREISPISLNKIPAVFYIQNIIDGFSFFNC